MAQDKPTLITLLLIDLFSMLSVASAIEPLRAANRLLARDVYAWRLISHLSLNYLSIADTRMGGGCTSGHMMSGMMQTAISGYVFSAGAFLTAIPIALFLFRKEA